MSPSSEPGLRGARPDVADRPPASGGDLRARLSGLTLRDEHRLGRRLERLLGEGEGEAAALGRLHDDFAAAEARIARRRATLPAVSYPPQLPVSARRADLLEAIRDHQVVVVAGETGSGKTTQLPKLCLELGRGMRGAIAHTQPRRLAARTVAERIAHELDVALGETVGYAVRFSDRSHEDTLVRLVTDGLLLAEVGHDKLLRRYDTIIVDEAHERSLNIDFLLGHLKSVLRRRPDLKLVITSATIDPERFSRHFDRAPIVEVSGRTYPVEVRYRPLESDGADRDQTEAIGDAVAELLAERSGDVLVFLSGEREIRDTAEALRARLASDVEVLPLFARLSSAEQRRVFRGHAGRRVVLATNVAETSLTVPGIRYVVDPGTARVSRYSARLKVQRLPIEPISQASADQRKGRCGRTSDGICVRLYSEDDFAARPRFTDPEILRTSLASVILQMAASGLGDIEDFPFLDPPDRRQVRDGLNLLHELGALDPSEKTARSAGRRLTPLGRRLAQLPVDPRMGRMVLEADRLACAEEVIVIAAALSIQDPRERPAEKRAQADQLHARFADERSDFLAHLNLWRYLRDQGQELSGSQLRRRCRAEFLNHLRVREWQDLAGQLRRAARNAGVTINQVPAEPREVHTALLSGLLSHVGLREGGRREFLGARGARFAIFPGSSLARRPPSWVMVAELVETSRLWGRTAARIEPGWLEPLAEHLLKRTYDEPRWVRRRGSVVATERATLYGLPVVGGRTVPYARIDPELSRELFVRRALVEGDWDTRHAFVARNAELRDEVQALEDRVRRRDILVDDQAVFDFYDARIPASVVSGAHFDRWWKDERRRAPDKLTFTRGDLIRPDALALALALAGSDADAWPERWREGDDSLRLSYAFEPGSEHDGVTVHVPLRVLGRLRAEDFEWLVPALRPELITTLIRSLPKELRRPLVPVPDVVALLVGRLRARREPLLDALGRELEALRRARIPRGAWDLSRLPAHLRMTFRIEDEDGRAIAEGLELARLRTEARPRLEAELAAAVPELERHGLRAWTIGALPQTVALPGSGGTMQAYPALTDEGETVGVGILDSPAAQQASMWTGTRRLLALTVPSPVCLVRDRLDLAAQYALSAAPHGSLAAVLEDAATAAIDALMVQAGGPAWDAEGFARLRDHVAGHLADATANMVGQVVPILDAGREVRERLAAPTALAAAEPVGRDVEAQLDRLLAPGFVTAAGARRLPDLERYLLAASRRLERLPKAPGADLERMREIQTLESAYRRRLEAWPGGQPLPEPLRELPWMLEELRVSHFAQALGTRVPISSKRIRRALEEAGAFA